MDKMVIVETELWGKNNPLFMYGNPEKLDDLLGRAFGEVVTGFEKSAAKSVGSQMEMAAKFGSFLSILGLGEIEGKISGEFDSSKAKTVLSKIPFDQKLKALEQYALTQDFFPYLNAFEGKSLERRPGQLVQSWPSTTIGPEHQVDNIGQILGIFEAERLVPPHDDNANIGSEYFGSQDTCWLLRSVSDSVVYVEMPIFLRHTRSNSQHGVMAFIKSNGRYKIECFGLLTWSDDKVTTDPIAWRLFY
ncbi:hypothetical protein LC092_03340 [Stappia stellulata]|uniref:hypothetical protein n=1 Tax=Stappia stellulata TaxID=71235 RepID=UPI001CD7DD05|nr:hypothetical protein [Stappia stellulata]MCA1241467.1 hypothetical protein [Stappia stellulata]